jgi:deoxyribonuclease-1
MKHLHIIFRLIIIFTIVITTTQSYAKTFSQAKQEMYAIHDDHRQTLYCDCKYDKHKTVNLDSCGYVTKKHPKRALRVEVEHIVPAAEFGRQRACWREPLCERKNGTTYKGRACCEKIDPVFRAMYTDLMNLAPAVGEVNSARRDYQFGYAQGEGYGKCQMIIDSYTKTAYPPERARGVVARAYLYMQKAYGLKLSAQKQKLYETWSKQYPVSEWEKAKMRRIDYLLHQQC